MFSLENIGLFGAIVLALDVWAIVNVASSPIPAGGKAVWIVLILLLPIMGFVIWLLLGPRAQRT